MDPISRRKMLFSLSQPTNPVPGALLAHLESQVTPKTISAWERNGWIRREGVKYYLTGEGSAILMDKGPTPPDSYYPLEYN